MEKKVKRAARFRFGQFDIDLEVGTTVQFNTTLRKVTVGGVTYTAPDAATFSELLNNDCFE